MHRRRFLVLAATTPALAQHQARPSLQAGTYVFTQHYSRLKQRAQDRIDDICATLIRAGYPDVELMSLFLTPEFQARTYTALARHGLACTAIYNGGVMHTPDGARETIAATVELAQRVRSHIPIRGVTVNPNPVSGRPKSAEELKVQADALNTLGWSLERAGLFLYLHNHAPELADDAREWRFTLANTESRYLRVCLDTHWVFRAGLDVMTLLREAGPRLASVHLRNSVDKIWSEDLSDGDVDHRAIAAYLNSIHYAGLLSVELAYDKETRLTRSLEQSLVLSRQYAERVFALKG